MTYLFNQAEIAKFNGSLFLNEHVLWFNVSMEEAMAVDVVKGRSDLVDYVPDLLMGERVVVELAHLHHLVQVHV